jgi:hypothetical protein
MSFNKVAEGATKVAVNPVKEKTHDARSEKDSHITRVFKDKVLSDEDTLDYEGQLFFESLERTDVGPSYDSSVLFDLDGESTDYESYLILQDILEGAPIITKTVQDSVETQTGFTYETPIPEWRAPVEEAPVEREAEPSFVVTLNEGWEHKDSMFFDGDSYRSSKQKTLQVKEEPKPETKQQLDLSANRPGVRARPPARVNLDELQKGSEVPFKYENKPLGKEPLGPAPQLKPRKAKVNRPIVSGTELIIYKDYARVTKGTAWTGIHVHEDYQSEGWKKQRQLEEKQNAILARKNQRDTALERLKRVTVEEEQTFVQAELEENPELAAFMPKKLPKGQLNEQQPKTTPSFVVDSTPVDSDLLFRKNMENEIADLGFEDQEYYADFEKLVQPEETRKDLFSSSEFLSDTQ